MNKQAAFCMGSFGGMAAGLIMCNSLMRSNDQQAFTVRALAFIFGVLLIALVWQHFDPPTDEESKCE